MEEVRMYCLGCGSKQSVGKIEVVSEIVGEKSRVQLTFRIATCSKCGGRIKDYLNCKKLTSGDGKDD